MQVKLTNICDIETGGTKDFIPSNGLSFLIETENKKILFDTGEKGSILINNMRLLNIDPNSIDSLVLSHGHFDHSFGIEALVTARTEKNELVIFGHPHAFAKRRVAKLLLRVAALIKYRWYNFGFPNLPDDVKEKLSFQSITEPYELTPFLKTIGEISEWKEKPSKIDELTIKLDDKYVKDELLDDLSLVLKTKEGIVVICGCGHAGVLNICARAKEIYPDDEIISIIGGTHLVALKEDEELD
ncbi:MAG: MBL fold metallo-hydrolase, partial [Candidatus Heimdallarchaeota archaeon]|nr:MBL fold metallo-hydrolase [Candidatus Heimdallarchaeota archaeon]